MPLFAYADETIFSISTNNSLQTLGCGLLITDKEITQEVIDKALKKLQLIEATNESNYKRNKRTLVRQFFHAKDDSNNGRESICEAINEEINGVFCVTYYDNIDPKEIKKTIHKEQFFARCLTSASIEFFNSIEKITLVIEQRESLKQVHVEQWKELLYHLLDDSSMKLPSFKTFYPEIAITLGDKKNPGLQVVDFLLWSCNRTKRIPPDSYWRTRLNYSSGHHSRIESSAENGGQYYLNGYKPVTEINYPVAFKKSETMQELVDAYVLIERVLRNLENADFNELTMHLYNDFISVREKLLKTGYVLNSADMAALGSIFIRLYDSLPVYKSVLDDDNATWTRLHHAKHIATLLLNLRYIEATRTRHYILEWRRQVQNTNALDKIMATDTME